MSTPCFPHLAGDEVAHLAIEAAQDLLAAIELGHRGAEAVEDRGELAGDVAAADHDQALRKRRQVEDLVRADRHLGARHRGRDRPAAGGDDDPLGAVDDAVHLDRPAPTRRARPRRMVTPAFVISSP
jgi:hypothetical protein